MRVVALEMGFKFGRRVRPGEEFDVDEGEAAPWFAPVGTDAAHAARGRAGRHDAPEPVTLTELTKAATGISGLEHAQRPKAAKPARPTPPAKGSVSDIA